MSTRKIAASTLWQLSSQIVMAALSIVTVKLVAIGLSIPLAGLYNTAYGYLQIFGILADFGLYAVSVREVARAGDQRTRILGNLMTLRMIILAISLGSALIIAWLIPHWSGTPLPIAITIAAFVPGFTLLAGMLRTIFQVEYRMQYVFIAEVAQRVVTVTLTGIVVFWGMRGSSDPLSLYALLFFGGLGSALLLLLSIVFSRGILPVRPRWDPEVLRRLLRLCAPYGIAFFCTALYRQLDVTMIGLLRPDDYDLQNAYYGFVQRMMDMAYLLPTFLMNSTLPILSEHDGRGEDTRRLLGNVLFTILLIGSVSALFSALWPEPLMRMLTTEQYLSTPDHPGSDTALRLLSISMFCNGMLIFAFYVLLTKHRWKPLVATLFVGVVLSLTMNVLLIPSMGFVGASTTSLLTHVVLTLLLLPQSLRAMPVGFTAAHALRLLVFCVLLAGFLFAVRPLLTHPLLTATALVASVLWMGGAAFVTRIHRIVL